MSIITGVFHDPFAQANIGLYPSAGVFPKFSAIGPMSFGLLWSNIWVDCGLTTSDSWASCGFTSTIGWSGCGFTNLISWSEC